MGCLEAAVADRTPAAISTSNSSSALPLRAATTSQSQPPLANPRRDSADAAHRTLVSSSAAPTDATAAAERASGGDRTDDAKASAAPPLDERSDATINSSERSSQSDGSSESSEETGEFGDEYDDVDGVATGGGSAQTRYLLKPMPSLLQVCPVDDLAVEEEKRRRRHSRNSGGGGGKRACADAESLPSAPSPLLLHRQASAQSGSAASAPSSSGSSASGAGAPPLLRRDSMAIRQQYWKQLGFNLTRSDLERTTGRRSVRHKGLKVRLNDDGTAKKGESKTFFQFFASWYSSSASEDNASSSSSTATSAPLSARARTASSSSSSSAPAARKSLRFDEEAELFYIPLHTDYSKRQRDCMWHTRVEFVAMVERNLEDVYDEMEREYEEQAQAEYLENERMAQEEARQRKVEADQRAQAASRAAAEAAAAAAAAVAAKHAAAASRARVASLSPVLRGRPQQSPLQQATPGPGAAVPTLALCPIDTQIKLAPRGRSPHAIRFQYLKHLGIPNSKNS
ncbi:hypothetical protein PybrP1_007481 [[Pythium] brassicae (nom. inval.)]|nr:hypothetical protein PybrP1_007481 [[Pythium] brassicae (nom. inval.)]